jgi:hypothetical protein
VTSFDLYSAEEWALALNLTSCVLELSDVLVGVERNHSIIMISSCNEHSWILLGLDVMQRRVLQQEVDVSFIICASIISGPGMSNSKFMESEHICNRHFTYSSSKEIWPLVGSCSNKKTAVGATVNNEIVSIGEALVDEILSCGDEVVESILLMFPRTLLMPLLSKFTSSSQTSNNQHPSHIFKEWKLLNLESWLKHSIEPTISMKNGWNGLTRFVFHSF